MENAVTRVSLVVLFLLEDHVVIVFHRRTWNDRRSTTIGGCLIASSLIGLGSMNPSLLVSWRERFDSIKV